MSKLTKSVIDAALPQDKDYIKWDSEIKGFGCRIYPSGIKTYVFFYRHPQTRKLISLKIGKHGNVTPDVARKIAQGFAGNVAHGIDPKEQKQEDKKQSITIADFVQLYLEQCAFLHNKPKTLQDYQGWLRRNIIPRLGNKLLSEITKQDIYDFHCSIPQKTTANRCLSVLSKMYSFAKELNYYDKENPVFGVKKHKENKMERFLKKEELNELENIIKLEELYHLKSPYVLAAIKMLAYTGCRMGEILKLKWEDVHLEENYIHFKKSKTGEKSVPLNKAAKEVLNSVEKQKGNPYVFCGEKPGTHLVQIQKAWQKIRKSAELSDVRIHDLRHSFASFMIKNGVSLFEVSKLLGHKNIQTTMRYVHLANQELVDIANKGGKAFETNHHTHQ